MSCQVSTAIRAPQVLLWLKDKTSEQRRSHVVPGDSPLAEAVKLLARAHQSLIWASPAARLRLRSALRDFYPGVLSALGAQLAEPEALAVLALAPTPEQGRRLTRAAVRRALVGAGRRRNLQARVAAVHAALAAPQLVAPAPVAAAYRRLRRPRVRPGPRALHDHRRPGRLADVGAEDQRPRPAPGRLRGRARRLPRLPAGQGPLHDDRRPRR